MFITSQIKFYQIFNRYFYKLTPIGTRRLGIRSSFYSNFLFDYLDDVLVEEPVPFPVELHPDVLHLGRGGGARWRQRVFFCIVIFT